MSSYSSLLACFFTFTFFVTSKAGVCSGMLGEALVLTCWAVLGGFWRMSSYACPSVLKSLAELIIYSSSTGSAAYIFHV